MTKPRYASHDAGRQSSRTSRFRERRVTPSQVFNTELKIFLHLCEKVDTPRSLACYLLARSGEWLQYLELKLPDPLSTSFADDYLVGEVMSKNPRLPIDVDRKSVAIQKFLDSERLCKETNERFASYLENPSQHHASLELIHSVSTIVARSLGDLSRRKLAIVERQFRFGPGATSVVSGSDVLPSKKYASQWEATPRLHPFVKHLKGCHNDKSVPLRAYSRVTTVPKNAKTDRTICIEPHANIYYQLGVGALLRDRLCKLGLDPDNQGRNREMARTAVKQGYATIDLSSASDTIASRVVYSLLPEDWFELLWLGRTDYCDLGDQTLKLEKFSSMGNGYTWELESLIFYAVARQLTEKEIGVFGDDLVVPVEIVPSLIESLNFFGFRVNERKSFWQGDFRESCGTDWWRGIDIRPFYFKKGSNEIRDLRHYGVQLANAIRVYAHRRGGRIYCDRRFLSTWLLAKRQAGELQNTYTSYGASDDGLVKNFDEARPTLLSRGYQGYRSRVCRSKPLTARNTDTLGAYLAALNHGTGEIPREREFARGMVSPLAYGIVPVFSWYDLGPWS